MQAKNSQKNSRLHKFATTIRYFKNRLFQTCIIVKRTGLLIYSKIGLVDRSKSCTQIYLQKILICINLQLAIRISENHVFRTCTDPSRTFRPIFRSIGRLDIKIPQKEIISADDRRTDRRTDGRTDGQTSRTTTIGIFFSKKREKLLKKRCNAFCLCQLMVNVNSVHRFSLCWH